MIHRFKMAHPHSTQIQAIPAPDTLSAKSEPPEEPRYKRSIEFEDYETTIEIHGEDEHSECSKIDQPGKAIPTLIQVIPASGTISTPSETQLQLPENTSHLSIQEYQRNQTRYRQLPENTSHQSIQEYQSYQTRYSRRSAEFEDFKTTIGISEEDEHNKDSENDHTGKVILMLVF